MPVPLSSMTIVVARPGSQESADPLLPFCVIVGAFGFAVVAMRTHDGNVTFRVDPAALAADPAWLTVTAWQGGGLHVDRLRRRYIFTTFLSSSLTPIPPLPAIAIRHPDGLHGLPIRHPHQVPLGSIHRSRRLHHLGQAHLL